MRAEEQRRIRLLDASMVNKIAAGEVVQRPLSVVKELVENAIDAGASAITTEIKDGGISYLRVTDNGCGIPRDQAAIAFLQHATSKIANADDLLRIMTLGFRGEALASIAAVARVEMITKTARDPMGFYIEIHGSNTIAEREIGCAEGTTVIVRDLFFNTPVRLKFLKKPTAEAGAIADMMDKLALGRPDIAFKHISGGNTVLQTNGSGDLKTALFYVYGKDIAKRLIPVQSQAEAYSLTGFLVKPDLTRGNRNYQNIFINGRYIKSELLQSAAEDAYKTALMSGKFPIFALCLRMAPDLVDVNVHPNKLEVRFREEDILYQWVREAAAAALDDANLIPQATLGPPSRFRPPSRPLPPTLPPRPQPPPRQALRLQEISAPPPEPIISEPIICEEIQESLDEIKTAHVSARYAVVGQIFGTYWLIEQGESLYIIDQHAAHERVLYEELLENLSKDAPASQRLLQPIEITLSVRERQVLEDNRVMLESFGFEIEDFGKQGAVIRAVPVLLRSPAKADFFSEILDRLEKISTAVTNPFELKRNAIATASCKAAIKANDYLHPAETRALIEKMLTLENPFTCPHGRPTVIEMNKREFEKKFKRT